MAIVRNDTDYRVNLDVFEGPLDLLLYLIKKNDLDIYDIPIAFILEEYVRYLESLVEMNIDLAGEFLLVAADLAYIKSKMLLPDAGTGTDDEEEGYDPRADLVRRLLEYRRYKDASEKLVERPMVGRDVFVRGDRDDEMDDSDQPIEGNVYDLISAFSAMLRKMPPKDVHDVMIDRISVNDRIMQLIELMNKDAVVALDEVMPAPFGRYDIVVTFLALLEMARLKIIKIYQGGLQDTIRIRCIIDKVANEDVMRLVSFDPGSMPSSDGATEESAALPHDSEET